MCNCPHCDKELKLPPYAKWNADQYGQSVLVVTLCCGKAVTVRPVRSFNIEAYVGPRTEDDWANTFKAQNPKKDSLSC